MPQMPSSQQLRKKVLFLCTGNSCRSQMAEGWLRELGADQYIACSAGIEAHGKNPRAIAAMQEAGVDISTQESEIMDLDQLDSVDLLVTVCSHADQHCPALPDSIYKAHWPFDDPAKASGSEAEIIAQFHRVRDQIKARIKDYIQTGV